MYEDDREESEQEILDEEDQHEDNAPVTTSDKAWGFWNWFFAIHGVALSAMGLASCIQQAMH